MHFDHVGVATDDATALAETFSHLLHAPVVHEERFDGLDVTFLDLAGDGYFELLEPVDDEGTIARFLADHGPGMHHVALRTENLEGALDRAREQGIRLIDEEPRPGAWGHQVAFLHPTDTGGVLVEFVQY